MLGDKFQVADVMVGHTLIWACGYEMTKRLNLLEGCPNLRRYLERLGDRPQMPAKLKELL
jgi:glutathione S-transferase